MLADSIYLLLLTAPDMAMLMSVPQGLPVAMLGKCFA